MDNLNLLIEDFIYNYVKNNNENDYFREPLIGYSSPLNEVFSKTHEESYPLLKSPYYFLENVETVLSFFIPYTFKVVSANRIIGRENASTTWTNAFHYSGKLINDMSKSIVNLCESIGIEATYIPPTQYDRPSDQLKWSHNLAAYGAGLGNFGINKLLITEKGCAGRFGTVLLSKEIPPTTNKRKEEPYCIYHINGGCTFCVDNCLIGALTIDSVDNEKCRSADLSKSESFLELDLNQSCGKCFIGPCSYFK